MTNTLWRPFGSELFEPFGSPDWGWSDSPLAELNRLSAEMDRMFRRFGDGNRSFAPQQRTRPWTCGRTETRFTSRPSCPGWRSATWRSM